MFRLRSSSSVPTFSDGSPATSTTGSESLSEAIGTVADAVVVGGAGVVVVVLVDVDVDAVVDVVVDVEDVGNTSGF